MLQATGTFQITMTPHETGEAASEPPEAPAIAGFALDKTFSGDLVGTGRGHMLAHTTATEGSAGYVAMETFEGTLGPLKGGFVLQHSGTMSRGDASLTVSIVPDSGRADLAGIRGSLTIDVVDGEHQYELSYQLD